MFVALSRFTVGNEMSGQVKEAFRNRPHLVNQASGFQRLDVISPADNPDEIWLITYWTDEESFTSWHRSHRFREVHQWIPKGLKVVPRSAKLQSFHHICS